MRHNENWVPYTMVNVLNFELRANEVGIPPTYDPWVKGFFFSLSPNIPSVKDRD